jgi:hypothetical protein
MSDNLSNPQGRIWFEGNPWPGGHRIASFRFGAHIDLDRGSWNPDMLGKRRALALDFELITERYDEEDGTDRFDSGPTDWTSKTVWNNFHTCRLSSSETSDLPGIGVSDGTVPFVFDQESYSFTADPLPIGDMEDFHTVAAFGIYVLGHDAAADHRIHLHSRQPDGSYTVEWTGKVARAYVGDDNFEYGFRAYLEGVRFDSISLFQYDPETARTMLGIELDTSVRPRDFIAPFVSDPDNFTFERRGAPGHPGHLHAVRR